MARKEVERIEQEEETVTKFACDECDKRYGSRGNHENRGLSTLVLDAKTMTRRPSGYSNWRSRRWDRVTSTGSVKLDGEAVIDLCNEPCLERQFLTEEEHEFDSIDEALAIDVEEVEYDVVREVDDVWLCDMCGTSMGEEADHTVSLNPRIKLIKEQRILVGNGPSIGRHGYEEKTEKIVYGLGDQLSGRGSNSRVVADRDTSFDLCDGCTNELFGIGGGTSANPLQLTVRNVGTMVNSIARVFKDTFTYGGV